MKNPVKAIQQTFRLLLIRKRAVDVYELAAQAEANPRLYRDPSWWQRVVTAGAALVSVIPLPREGRRSMNNLFAKLTMVAGTVVAVAGALQHAPIPAKYQGIAAMIGSMAATLAGLYHPVPAVTDQP